MCFSNQWSLKAICLILTHSCTHSHTDGGVSHAMRRPARREQLGLGALLRDTSTLSHEEPGDRTSHLPVTSQPVFFGVIALPYIKPTPVSRVRLLT